MKPNISKIKIEIESENDPFFIAKFEYFIGYIDATRTFSIL